MNVSSNITNSAWAKRLGWMLPLFFLIKGLLWLVVPLVTAAVILE